MLLESDDLARIRTIQTRTNATIDTRDVCEPPVIVSEQQEVIHALSLPDFHGASVHEVERIDTHISVVFLAGSRVLKLKRAVKFDYVDFSTLEKRRAACEAEVAANARTAPALYHGVVAVTREPDGRLALGGEGQPVDYVVDMARFDQATLFDRMASRGALTRPLMSELAAEIAAFHGSASARRDHGGQKGMAWVVEGNLEALGAHVPDVFASEVCRALAHGTRAELARHATLLDARRARGLVRQCHGDLHLRNICLVDGRPTLFDAIEFNEELSCVDTAYDLAFLVMDLAHRQLLPWAHVVLNEYTQRTGDREALALFPLFLSCRAAVRAKIGADAAEVQTDAVVADDMRAEARDYLALALACITPPGPTLVAIGGLSGSGKSTIAARLAPDIGALPGALVLRSDVIRKRLCGAASALDRLPASAYAPDVTARVYQTLASEAAEILSTGHSVIADAVYVDPRERAAIEAAAVAVGARFHGIWLEAPAELLAARISARLDDASDATPDVLDRQRQQLPDDIAWHRVNASGSPEHVIEHVRGALAAHHAIRAPLAAERPR